MNYDIFLPDLGEGIESAEVSEISVSVGDLIEKDTTILVLESDKASMEIPADVSGEIKEIAIKKGQEVKTGDLLIKVELKQSEMEVEVSSQPKKQETKETKETEVPEINIEKKQKQETPNGGVFASPGVRRLSRELEIDLKNIRPTGKKGRITKEDLHSFIKNKINQAVTTTGKGKEPRQKIDFSQWGPIEQKPLSKIQKIAGGRLQNAWTEIPHVTQFNTADITDLNEFRKKLKKQNEPAGIKITFLPFLLKAAVLLLKKHPQFNSSLDHAEENIVLKNYYHIGVAVDTNQGLVVPVIRDVDRKSIVELSKELESISKKARNKKLSAKELNGASFTISSLGGIGGEYFTPIVNPPEVAIMGISKSRWKPVFDISSNDFKPRFVLPYSISYDHRVIDGADGSRFVKDFSLILEDINNFQ